MGKPTMDVPAAKKQFSHAGVFVDIDKFSLKEEVQIMIRIRTVF